MCKAVDLDSNFALWNVLRGKEKGLWEGGCGVYTRGMEKGAGEEGTQGGGGGGLTRSPVDDIRGSKGANVAADSLDQLLLQLRAVLCILHEGDICVNALPLHWMLIPAKSPTHAQAWHCTETQGRTCLVIYTTRLARMSRSVQAAC